MSVEITKMYQNLNKLCETVDAFKFADQKSIGGGTYRIFSYRLASYSDFLNESAIECRGITFEIDPVTFEMKRLVARPPYKFFNAYENPFTMYPKTLTVDDIDLCMIKMDGSLINTFVDVDGKVITKSHTSLSSDHAIISLKILENNPEFYEEVTRATKDGYTVNMEFTSPIYRIVVSYNKDDLTVLNLRNVSTGKYLDPDDVKEKYPKLFDKSVYKIGRINNLFPKFEPSTPFETVVNTIHQMADEKIEGFVIQFKNGDMCKVKTDWYCSLHYSKDSVLIDSRLFDVVLNGASDDVRQLFGDDEHILKRIEIMERIVFSCYNRLVKTTEEFVRDNKHLDKKEFALKVIAEAPKDLGIQHAIFNANSNKTNDYKEILKKQQSYILGIYRDTVCNEISFEE